MNKKRYLILVAIIIFIFLSLFTFANPFEKEEINDSRVLDEIEEDELVEEKLDNTIITNPVPNIIDIEDNSYDLALNAVVRAEVSLEKEKYNIALSLTNNVKDEVKKVELEERLEKVLDTIDLINLVKELIEKTNTSKNKIELDGARDYEKTNEIIFRVSKLFNETLKEKLNSDIDSISLLLEDKTSPNINIDDEEALNKITKIEVTDDSDFIIELTKEGEESIKVENGYEVTDGAYELVVIDNAFNEKRITFIVDTISPVGTITYSTTDLTNKAVIATLKTDEDVTVTNNDGSFEYIFEDNGEFEFEFIDVAGNIGKAKAIVNNMDFTKPTLSLEACADGTCVRGMDNLDIIFYVYIDGELKHTIDSKTSPGGKYFSLDCLGDGNYKIEAVDYAGNESNVLELVIDHTNPEIILSGTEGLNKNEYIIESGDEVTLDDIMAKVVDNIDGEIYIAPYKAHLLISDIASENKYNYDFTNGFDTNYHGRYNLYYEYTDKAGNKTEAVMLLVMKDTTAPIITLKGTEGRRENELRVKKGDVVTLDDVTAISNDITGGLQTLYPTKIMRYYPIETGIAGHKYDAVNGFDTSSNGYYIIYYESIDKAGNKTEKDMLLVVK